MGKRAGGKRIENAGSLLLILEPGFDRVALLVRHLRRGFLEHRHEPRHFLRREGMADVRAARFAFEGAIAVDDEFTARVEEGDEWQPGTLAANFLHDAFAAGVFEVLLGRRLFDNKFGEDEMAFEDGLDVAGLDKLIESFAPPSPRRVEGEENGFVFFGGPGFGFGQHFVGGGRRLGEHGERDKERRKNNEAKFCAHGRTMFRTRPPARQIQTAHERHEPARLFLICAAAVLWLKMPRKP